MTSRRSPDDVEVGEDAFAEEGRRVAPTIAMLVTARSAKRPLPASNVTLSWSGRSRKRATQRTVGTAMHRAQHERPTGHVSPSPHLKLPPEANQSALIEQSIHRTRP